MSVNSRSRSLLVPFLLLMLAVLVIAIAGSQAQPAVASGGPMTVASIESLGVVTFPTGTMFGEAETETEIGGLSGITYDEARGVYYALSDDRSSMARYYTVGIDVSDGSLDPGDVVFLDVTILRDKNGKSFVGGSLDPEGIELVAEGQLFISSEGDSDASPPINPFVNRFNPTGKQNRALIVPDKFLPDGNETFGVRDNLAFEGLTSAGHFLYTATENALHQDGPASTLVTSSPSRFLEFDLGGKRAGNEYVYMVDPIPATPIPPDAFADNGLPEIQALDDVGTFLAMERSYAVGVGNTVRLFETSTQGATEVSGYESLMGMTYTPMSKHLVADFETDLGVVPDNLEGMTFGPMLPDGRILLIVVSDNNFNPTQITQFVALAVELVPAP